MENKSYLLKWSLFATGLSGIVAEYILSTLASYFLGDSVVQWTLIVSTMLFSMGVGARLSKRFHDHILFYFILIEFSLSILVSISATTVYLVSGVTIYTGFIIYLLSVLIGILIGMEIPLVIRLNDTFESLKVNIATVLEKDYWGSLLGGLLYAFVFLPKLGMGYTPLLLGFVNLSVAFVLFYKTKGLFLNRQKRTIIGYGLLPVSILLVSVFFAKQDIFFGEQRRYKDKVIYTEQTAYQKLVLTQWKDNYWLYINGNEQFSSMDEYMYHEPLVHPAMQLHKDWRQKNILVLGGGDGLAAREILKFEGVKSITLVDLDPSMTQLGKTHKVLKRLNGGSLSNPKVRIVNTDGMIFLERSNAVYDLIVVDLPDPKTIELNRFYSQEFYQLCALHLPKNGLIVTQAGSPYYASKAFLCINKTLSASGFGTAKLHHQVLTLGEWGWVMGIKNKAVNLKQQLQTMTLDTTVTSKWINKEAIVMMTSFGKHIYKAIDTTTIDINQIHHPVLYQYYLKGDWDIY